MATIPLQDLNGPHKKDAEDIIRTALDMTDAEARALETAWDMSPSVTGDQLEYLKHCKTVWDALEESGRFLPIGWFEAIFADCAWIDTTRALHSVADAVCATLVRDLVPESCYRYLSASWTSVMAVSVN